MAEEERAIIEQEAGPGRIALIASSYLRLFGEELVTSEPGLADALWHLPAVVLAHGTQDDPIFFYANRTALDLFELTPEQLIAMPSRKSAEPMHRNERARFMAQVSEQGRVDNYAGVRVTSTGRRFRMERARVWNLTDEAGQYHGQAATFDQWVWLD